MKLRVIYLAGLMLAAFVVTGCTTIQPTKVVYKDKEVTPEKEQTWFSKGEGGIHLIATNNISAQLKVTGENIRVSGRSSIHLASSDALMKEGSIFVKGFNLAFFDAPQQMLAKNIDVKKQNGILGFTATSEKPQKLKYDRGTGRVTGEIQGYIDAAYMSKLIKGPAMDGKGDYFDIFTQPATLMVEFTLGTPIAMDEKEEHRYGKGDFSFRLKADKAMYKKAEITAFELNTLEKYPFEYEVGKWVLFEVGKSLCVQPVRIARIRMISPWPKPWPWEPVQFTVEYTGAGLAFGQPRANSLWAKADIVFNYRDWKTIWKLGYWVVSTNGGWTSTEQSNLMAEVDDADCIEVFFIDEFDPVDWGGGGATWGRGTSPAKIITSDANADGGIDLTHLAHELGHVVNLKHPGDPSPNSSTGTLMCPSGYLNDNPNVMSQENKDNASNPLLTFIFKVRSSGPDCQDSADCGACP